MRITANATPVPRSRNCSRSSRSSSKAPHQSSSKLRIADTPSKVGTPRGDASKTASGAKRPSTASRSPRFAASSCLSESSTRSGVGGSLGIALPFLGKAFGGSTGLVDVVGRKARDQASHPDEDPSLALSKVTGAASRTSVLSDHGKHNSIAEVADFLKPDLQLLVRAKPVLKEAANGRPPLEDGPHRPPLKDGIRSEAACHAVEIPAIRSLELPAHQLHVRLRHR